MMQLCLAKATNALIFFIEFLSFMTLYAFPYPPAAHHDLAGSPYTLLHLIPALVCANAFIIALVRHQLALGGIFLSLAWGLVDLLILKMVITGTSDINVYALLGFGIILSIGVAFVMRALAVYSGGEENLGLLQYACVPRRSRDRMHKQKNGVAENMDVLATVSTAQLTRDDVDVEGGLPPPYGVDVYDADSNDKCTK
ncbi:hypothetical protein Hypma_003043 [Hypsizygus marmoreus]|uniref:Uncharacterized protein n=1 Tax=Hypsizygus marmoreus TaxID=39966 RepID=A0A369J2S4_HYPMA|nr:hypothetical protein Hypma_003043 [Hypsizygus marmoreus]